MAQTKNNLSTTKNEEFDKATHLFATNELVKLHNKKMLKQLNLPIVLSSARFSTQRSTDINNDDQLQQEVLLCIGQQIMLTTNLWINAGLVNGSLGQVKEIIYDIDSKPPDLPRYVIVNFKNYIGLVWDTHYPNNVPITPITRGNHTQLPLAMAWAITIHKS